MDGWKDGETRDWRLSAANGGSDGEEAAGILSTCC